MNAMHKLFAVIFALVLVTGCQQSADDEGDGTGGADSMSGAGDTSGSGLENVVYFEFDKSDLTPESVEVLKQQASRLQSSGAKVTVEGHCDERGTREYNMALGERRAKAVADFLVVNGVSSSQVETVSYGEERPAVAESNEYAWSKNRRAELR